jgi:hypothetical protein
MIDEKMFIKELYKFADEEIEKSEEMYKAKNFDMLMHHKYGENCFYKAIQKAKDMPKVGEWISCSERLPEVEGTMYWTTHEDGSVVQHGWSERHGFIYNWELGEKREKMGTVIAWMPMFKPIPYKE